MERVGFMGIEAPETSVPASLQERISELTCLTSQLNGGGGRGAGWGAPWRAGVGAEDDHVRPPASPLPLTMEVRGCQLPTP